MNAVRTILATLLSATALAFGATVPAQAADPTHENVNDAQVIGHQWQLLNPRTTAPATPGAHFTITWGTGLQGNDGCNDFWGHASVDGVSRTVTFDIEGQTLKGCEDKPAFDVMQLQGTYTYAVYGGRLIISNDKLDRFSFSH